MGGDNVTKNQLGAMEGMLVALCLDDGSSVFKRIGKPVPGTGGRLWQFESVGGLGGSIVVSLVEPDETSDVPRFRLRAEQLAFSTPSDEWRAA
jgi:hypothetical protein